MVKEKNGDLVEPDATEEIVTEEVVVEPEPVDVPIEDLLKEVEFDMTQLTARQYAEIDKYKNSEAKYFGGILSKVVVKGPKAWGDVTDPESWNQLPLFGIVAPVFSAFVAEADKLPKTLEGIVYNLDSVTPVEFEIQKNKLAAVRTIHEQALALTKVVVECEELFGGPAVLDNWLDAPFYTVFVPARNGYGMAAKDLLTNFLRRFGSG